MEEDSYKRKSKANTGKEKNRKTVSDRIIIRATQAVKRRTAKKLFGSLITPPKKKREGGRWRATACQGISVHMRKPLAALMGGADRRA